MNQQGKFNQIKNEIEAKYEIFDTSRYSQLGIDSSGYAIAHLDSSFDLDELEEIVKAMKEAEVKTNAIREV